MNLLPKDISGREVQFLKNIFDSPQRRGLVAIDQAIKGRFSDSQLLGKTRIAPFTAVELEKSRECLVETGHPSSQARKPFRMRMIFPIGMDLNAMISG